MKSILRKIQVILLAALMAFAAGYSTNKVLLQNNADNQYVLSRYSHNKNLVRSLRYKQSSDVLASISLPENTKESSNWGGYIVTSGKSYTSISGSWIIPKISGNQQNSAAAQWVGLGGVDSSDLLQMGTIEQMENGKSTADVFWEQLPDSAKNVISVPVGSTITVAIFRSSSSSTKWNLTFVVSKAGDKTQTKTISTTLDSSYAKGIETSAEWISEDPSNEYGQLVPLANMGTVNYQSAVADGKSLNSSGNNVQPVATVSSNGTFLIYPSQLGTGGKSFTTTNSSLSFSQTRGFQVPVFWRSQRHFRWNW